MTTRTCGRPIGTTTIPAIGTTIWASAWLAVLEPDPGWIPRTEPDGSPPPHATANTSARPLLVDRSGILTRQFLRSERVEGRGRAFTERVVHDALMKFLDPIFDVWQTADSYARRCCNWSVVPGGQMRCLFSPERLACVPLDRLVAGDKWSMTIGGRSGNRATNSKVPPIAST